MISHGLKTILVLSIAMRLLSFVLPVTALEKDFCQTWEVYKQKQIDKYGRVLYHNCYNSICDDPSYRDAAIPGPGDPIRYMRLYFHIFCEDDGSN